MEGIIKQLERQLNVQNKQLKMLKVKRGKTEPDYPNQIYSLDNISMNEKSPSKEPASRLRTIEDDFNTTDKETKTSSLVILSKNNPGSSFEGSDKSKAKKRRKKRVCSSYLDGFKESWKQSLIQQRMTIKQLEDMPQIQGEVDECGGQHISGKVLTEPATRTSCSISSRSGRLPSLTPQTDNKITLQRFLSEQRGGDTYFRQGNENLPVLCTRNIHNQSSEYQQILPEIVMSDFKKIQKQSRYQNQLQILSALTPSHPGAADSRNISQRTNSKYVELFYSDHSSKNTQQKQQQRDLCQEQEKCKLLAVDESIKVRECLGDSGVSSLTSSTVQHTNRNDNNTNYKDLSNSHQNNNLETNYCQGQQNQYLQDNIQKDYQFLLKESAMKSRRRSNICRKSKESYGQVFEVAASPNLGVRASYRLFQSKQQQQHLSPQQAEVAPGQDWVSQLRKGPARTSSTMSCQLTNERSKFLQQMSQDNQVVERSQQNEQHICSQIQQQPYQQSPLNPIQPQRYPLAIKIDPINNNNSKFQQFSTPENISCLSSICDKTISSTIITHSNKNTLSHNKTGLESQEKMAQKIILTSSIDTSNSPNRKNTIIDPQVHLYPQPLQFKFLLPQKYQQKDIEEIQNRLLTLESLTMFPSWWQDVMLPSDGNQIGQFDVDGFVINWDRKKTVSEEIIEFTIKDLTGMEDCRVCLKINEPSFMKRWKFEKVLLEIIDRKSNANEQANNSSHRELLGVNKDTGLKSSFSIWECKDKSYFFQAIKSICLSAVVNNSYQTNSISRITLGICMLDSNSCVLAFENQQVCLPVKTENCECNYINESILNNESQFWTYPRVLQLIMDGLGVMGSLFAAGIDVVQQFNFQFNMRSSAFQLHHLTQAIKINDLDKNSCSKEGDSSQNNNLIDGKLQNCLQVFGNLVTSLCKQSTVETNIFESSQYQKVLGEVLSELLCLKLITAEKIPLRGVPSFIKDRFFDSLIVQKIQLQKQQLLVLPGEYQKPKSRSISKSLAAGSQSRNSQTNKCLVSSKSGNNNNTNIARNKLSRIPREQARSFSSNSAAISTQSSRARAISQVRRGSRLSNYSKDMLDDQDLTTIKETINTLHEESGSVHINSLTPQYSKDSQSSRMLQAERRKSAKLIQSTQGQSSKQLIQKSASSNPIDATSNSSSQNDSNLQELKTISDSYRQCQQIDNYLQSQGKVLSVYRESLDVGCVDFLDAVASLSQFCLEHQKLEILFSLVDLCLDLNFQQSLRFISKTNQDQILRLFLLAAFKALALSNIKKAIQLLQTTLELQNLASHELFQIHLDLGILFRQMDNKSAALSHFVASQEAAVNVYPSSLELAAPFLQAGTITDNERYLEIALKIKKSNGEKPLRVLALTFKLGCMQLKKALFKEAEESFRSYLELINSHSLSSQEVGSSVNTQPNNSKESQIFQARLNLRLSQLGQDPHHPCLIDLINNCYKEMVLSHNNLSPKTAVLAICEIAEVLQSIKVPKNQILPLYAQCSVLASKDADRSLLTLVAQKLAECQSAI